MGLFVVALLLQAATGAYVSDSTAFADDPAHLISGLLVRDYLVHGLGSSPVEFAREYYAHYPKIAIGNWPPLFHAIQGLWLLVFPRHPASVLVLLAVLASVTAWLAFRHFRRVLGAPWALLGAVLFLVVAPTPYYAGSVMAEIPLALFCVLAVLAWSRFLRDMRSRDAIAFALWTVLAVLTKWNGLLLVLVPPLSIVMSGRWRVLRAPVVWKAAVAIAVLTVPLVLVALPTLRSGWESHDRIFGIVSNTIAYYGVAIPRVLGYGVVAMAALGLVLHLSRRERPDPGDAPLWCTAGAMAVATLVFHVVAPAGMDVRHMIPAHPFVAMMVAAFALWLATRLRQWWRQGAAAAVVAIGAVVALVLVETLPLRNVHLHGFGAAAEALLRAVPAGRPVRTLVSSDVQGEGAMAVELAFRDRARPSHTAWRATKLLSSSTWAGRDYQLRAESAPALIELLERAGITSVVLDRSLERFAHQELLEDAIAAHPERFRLRDRLPLRRHQTLHPDALLVYEFLHPGPHGPEPQLRQVPGYDGVEQITAAPARAPMRPQ